MPTALPTALTPAESLITPFSMSSEGACSTTPSDFFLESPSAVTTQDEMMNIEPHTTVASILDDLESYTVSTLAPRSETFNTPHRQLLRLQRRLCEISCLSIVKDLDELKSIFSETTAASRRLLDIITAVTNSTPSQIKFIGQIDAATILLAAACYAHILRHSDALANRLHHVVTSTSSDGEFPDLPCVQIGSIPHAAFATPAIQMSLIVQFLSQSLSEIERRLPLLGREVPTHQPLTYIPPGSSSIAEMISSINSDVANLAAHVKETLSSILDLL